MFPPEKISLNKKLKVKFIDYAEPDNGRELWRVEVGYEGEDITAEVFSGGWNYLNFNLENWDPEDKKTGYFFLPAEGRAILIDTKTKLKKLKFHVLPYQNISTARFRGNRFEFGRLLEIFLDIVVITDLETLTSRQIRVAGGEIIREAKLINEREIEITAVQKIRDEESRIRKRYQLEAAERIQ